MTSLNYIVSMNHNLFKKYLLMDIKLILTFWYKERSHEQISTQIDVLLYLGITFDTKYRV